MEKHSEKGQERSQGVPPTKPQSGPQLNSGKILETRPVTAKVQPKEPVSFVIDRFFTHPGENPLDAVQTVKASSSIKEKDGSMVFEMKDLEAPKAWSQLAIDIVVSKYFRKAGVPKTGHETTVRQVVYRIAHTIRVMGEKYGYFDAKNGKTFEDELLYLLIHQVGAFNSPVWFNVGLHHEYGIKGNNGNFAWNFEKGLPEAIQNNYERPQSSACFIQAVEDDLMAIFQLIKDEARLFKYGSGTGTNFSKLRSKQENLSGGGTSSGLMSFLEVFDRGAGATKSGGTTRRAAKMVCLDIDHPEIVDFIEWKMREERKVAALIAAGYSSEYEGEAYKTVSGQNSNNSVRVTDDFMHAVERGQKWQTRARTTGRPVDIYEAKDLWQKIAKAAWSCADPGLQFDTTINDWHTCSISGRINASNPCSEYMFLDDTACNLASLNLVKFLRRDGSFDLEAYRQACRVFILAQEILVDFSCYPTEKIARNSHDYRPLGLGYANLGTMLMLKGIPYDSDEGRAWAAGLTSVMTGHAYAVSAEIAQQQGAFVGFEKNKKSMLRVIQKHRKAVEQINSKVIPSELFHAAKEDWDAAYALGEKYGFKNSQVTVLAPTGTIGLLMDCDTTGVEPDFALVKFKKLAGGGYFKIVNQSVPTALHNLGYSQPQIEEILRFVLGSMSLEAAPHVNWEFLKEKGFKEKDIDKIEKSLPTLFDLRAGFTRFVLGDALLKRIGVPQEAFEDSQFNFLNWSGLTEDQIEEANEMVCGTMTLEGAPHIQAKHLAVFDCANRCGKKGKRFIAPMGHVRMMAAVQPFLSGAISKTVNLPQETTVDEIQDIYLQAWKSGLKAIAVYRDGSKLSQPLSSKSKDGKKSASAEPASDATQAATRVIRHKLPNKRLGFTQEAVVGGHKVYLRTGEYEDGTLGEIFLDMHKEGAAFRALLNCFAISTSLGLQYGVPLQEFVDKFTFTRFDPSGFVEGHPNIKSATSVVDYVFRVLGFEYLDRTDFVQVKPAALAADTAGTSELAKPKEVEEPTKSEFKPVIGNPESAQLASLMGDAPPCDQCGHTTVRNGACYRCLNCGNSMGCS